MSPDDTSNHTRRTRWFALLPIVILLAGLFIAQTPPTGHADTEPGPVYLPLVVGGNAEVAADPTLTPTTTATPTATTTPTPTATLTATATPTSTPDTPKSGLTGYVRLRPEHVDSAVASQPVRYAVVLDVSGSMNLNFAGLGKGGLQCGNAPGVNPLDRPDCSPLPHYAWETMEERRIYVAKNAIKHLIDLTNMPGNDYYNPALPTDEMIIMAFRQAWDFRSMTEWSNDTSILANAVDTVGADNGDPYKTEGGTNGAAGLYGASLALNGDNTVTFAGKEYAYKTVVIFVTDGISNHLFDPDGPGYQANRHGNNRPEYFPAGHICASGQIYIPETIECHINAMVIDPDHPEREGKLLLNGILYDRPINAMVNVSNEHLKSNGHEVHVIALSSIPRNGLQDGVASSPTLYYEARDLEVDPDTGRNNVDMIFERIYTKVVNGTCQPVVGNWINTFDAADMPDGQVGVATLSNPSDESSYVVPIIVDAQTGQMQFTFSGIPPGEYLLEGYVQYRGADGVTRKYARFFDETTSTTAPTIPIQIKADSPVILDPVSLVLDGDVCAAP